MILLIHEFVLSMLMYLRWSWSELDWKERRIVPWLMTGQTVSLTLPFIIQILVNI